MNMDENDFVLTEAEVAAAQQELDVSPTGLGVKPDAQPTPAAVATTVPPEDRDRFTWMMQALTAPAKRVIFHYTVGDESLTRSVVAWGHPDTGAVATMAQTGTLLRFGTRSAEDLVLVTADVLAVDAGVHETVLGLTMSVSGLLTWLAIVEHLRALKLSAVLGHYAPEHFFNRAEVEARLAGAVDEDFRWPLMFFAKVLPADGAAALGGVDLEEGLAELEALEIIEDAGAGIWETTHQGDWLAGEITSSVSKVGCGVAAHRPDGAVGYRTMMFVRSPLHVLMLVIDGDEGVIAAVSADRVVEFVEDVFASPDSDGSPIAAAGVFCPACGAEMHSGDRFCAQCGAPAPGGVS